MKAVHNHPFSFKSAKFSLELPVGWKFLSVVVSDKGPEHTTQTKMYVEVKEGMMKETVNFKLLGTGHEVDDSATFLTTFTVGPFVFHLFKL